MKKDLFLVFTGDGKCETTSKLGMAIGSTWYGLNRWITGFDK